MGNSRSKSSKRWLERHHKDDYVKKAISEGYRSRAAYKLLEINKRDKLMRPGMRVLDLGAAPGGWSQVAVELVGKNHVIALDILAIDPINGVDIIQGDFRDDAVYADLLTKLAGNKVDLVISDMAPNFSGIGDIDVLRTVHLAEIALECSKTVLEPGGGFLVKLFQGAGFEDFHKSLQVLFDQVVVRKPKASRTESREVYLLATGYKEVSLE